jgi:osmotically-inducible protein OsmY
MAQRVPRKNYTEDAARKAREKASRTGESVGDTLDDARIHTKIRNKLAAEGEMPFGGINVDVAKNVVVLRGSAESQQAKAEAERITRETDRVTKVVNRTR